MTTFVVSNLNDSGSDSLRDAIAQANLNAGADTITFAMGLAGGAITLTSGQIEVTDAVTIDGDNVAISGNNASRVFEIASTGNLTADHLVITGGNAGTNGAGGGINV